MTLELEKKLVTTIKIHRPSLRLSQEAEQILTISLTKYVKSKCVSVCALYAFSAGAFIYEEPVLPEGQKN